jgi:hypothetical protein
LRDNPGLEYAIPLGLDAVAEYLQNIFIRVPSRPFAVEKSLA